MVGIDVEYKTVCDNFHLLLVLWLAIRRVLLHLSFHHCDAILLSTNLKMYISKDFQSVIEYLAQCSSGSSIVIFLFHFILYFE